MRRLARSLMAFTLIVGLGAAVQADPDRRDKREGTKPSPSVSDETRREERAEAMANRMAERKAKAATSRERFGKRVEGPFGERASQSEERRARAQALASQMIRSQTKGSKFRDSGGADPSAVSAPYPSPTDTLNVAGQIHLGGDIFKGGAVPFLWSDGGGGNTGLGEWANTYTGGPGNTGVGFAAGYVSYGLGSTNVGVYAGLFTAYGPNTSVGYNAGRYSYSYYNTNIGSRAGQFQIYNIGNTAIGHRSQNYNRAGYVNTTVGYYTMPFTTYASGNSALGGFAMLLNSYGIYNTAVGFAASYSNSSGNYNTALGSLALAMNTYGNNNTAIGSRALYGATGSLNTAVGAFTGTASYNYNVFLGQGAGSNIGPASYDNIMLGSYGYYGEQSTLRLGNAGFQTRAFISGTRGVSTGYNDAIPVLIDSTGQLGTVSSSRRYKDSIEDMGSVSERLLALRPVTFRFKEPFENGDKPIQFGLIAEEVAEVFPELVVYDAEGQPETVKYHLLATLLLNEMQKISEMQGTEQAELSALRSEVAELRTLRAEVAELRELTVRLAGLQGAKPPAPATHGN